MRILSLLPAGLLVLPLAACASHRDAAGADARPEQSVRPGLNDRFLAPDLEVEELVDTFEGESREIARERDAIVAALAIEPGDRVADVGAGTGLFLGAFDAAVGPGGRVYALDISPTLVEHMRERARTLGWRRVEVALCGERSVDLPTGSIDLAFVCDTYHHFEYPQSTLASLADALVPGGRLVVVDFERIPGHSRQWILDHVRAGKEEFAAEIVAAGFELVGELPVPGLEENYVLAFRRP